MSPDGCVAEAAGLPRRELVQTHDGDAAIETYSLRYADGEPSLATFACLLDDGRRTWARSTDPATMAEMLAAETCGRRARLKNGELIGM